MYWIFCVSVPWYFFDYLLRNNYVSKRGILIVDFDDTLCIHTTVAKADITTGIPNTELIQALNKLYESGFEIHIYTARGSASTNSRQEADKKYRDIMTKWLNENNVKFNKLSFEKPIGIYYVDDKAVRPDELDKLQKLMEE